MLSELGSPHAGRASDKAAVLPGHFSPLLSERCTISGVKHCRNSVCITGLIERMSISPSHLRSYRSPSSPQSIDASRIVVTTLNSRRGCPCRGHRRPRHQQGLRVSAILLFCHPARPVRPSPEGDVPVGPTLQHLASHAAPPLRGRPVRRQANGIHMRGRSCRTGRQPGRRRPGESKS